MKRYGCTGCLSSLLLLIGLSYAVFILLTPWAFHMGGRWSPFPSWTGVGQLRDSYGAQYGMVLTISPYLPTGRGNPGLQIHHRAWPRVDLRGDATLCTAAGTIHKYKMTGEIYGAWRDADGKEVRLYLTDKTAPRVLVPLRLDGFWHGPSLVLDDQKTMFMDFRPGGDLRPAPSYTSPVPERHATVTLTAGTYSDVCK